jgi:putative phosphoesterase
MRIGVISDTHGLLRAEALAALQGVDHILHAGDVGDIEILDTLKKIAPVTAIRGNVDTHGACAELPATEMVELGGKNFYLVHSVHDLDVVPEAAGIACVVSGHSHKPEIFYSEKQERRGVLYLNPGSAGPRRFSLPVSVAIVEIGGGTMRAEIVELL